jgi:hypothetical protein
LPAVPTGVENADWESRKRRLEASIEASKQTLADVDARRKQSVTEVEAALGHGRREGEDALGAAASLMGTYLAAQESELTATEAAVAGIVDGQRSAR